MGRSKKKKKKAPEEEVMDPIEGAEGVEDLSVDAAAEPAVDATSGGAAAEDLGDMDATSGGSAAEGLDDILGDLTDENSPLIPDPLDDEADAKALENEAKDLAIEDAKAAGRKKGGLSATAAKRKAKQEKKKANRLAAVKAESAEQQQKEKIKRQRTVASQQNKTARERILRGETGARGRMFNRINARFQIPDAPMNFPRIGGSGNTFN